MGLAMKFGMENSLSRSVPAIPIINLSSEGCPTTFEEVDKTLYKRYRSMLGAIAHVANWSHPELCYSVSVASQYMANPGKPQMEYVENIMRYLIHAKDHVRTIRRQTNSKRPWLFGFTDADLGSGGVLPIAGQRSDRRSKTGFFFFLFGNLVGHQSRLQPSVSLSTAESEYQALCAGSQFAVWMVRMMNEIGLQVAEPVKMYCDNRSALHICRNPVHHKYTKHIDTRLNWIKSAVRTKVIDPVWTPTNANCSDIGTKALSYKKFAEFRDAILGRIQVPLPNEHKVRNFADIHSNFLVEI
jgi:hypothetical protein